MAFLLQVWVVVLGREALCFGKLHQIHQAIGIPFPALFSDFLHPITVRGPYSAARSQWAGLTLRFQMLANLSEGTGVPSVCLWSRSRGGSMGKGSHRRGSTPADR